MKWKKSSDSIAVSKFQDKQIWNFLRENLRKIFHVWSKLKESLLDIEVLSMYFMENYAK